MAGRNELHRRQRTISITNIILIIILIILMAVGFFSYLRYRNLGESPISKLRYTLNREPRFLFNIYGDEDHLLKSPMAVFTAKNGMIYVANTEEHSVEVFKPNGTYVFSFGGLGTDPGKMSFPYGITQDNEGNILVAESGNSRIQVFSQDGQFIRIFADKSNKDLGLQKPGPLYRDSQGNIYIADLAAQKVIVIGKNGRKLGTFSGIQYPHGIVLDKKNRVYISDSGHNRVVVFDEKGKQLSSIETWNENTPFSMIRGIAVNSRDEIFITDTVACKIRVLDSNYKYKYSFGLRGMEKGSFVYPSGIFIDDKEKIYIADWGNNRIQVWGY